MECQANLPYPTPKVEGPNREYAELLLEDYAGRVSEQTAVHLYLYQHFVEDAKWEEFAKVIKQISMVEMRHMALLGETIVLLGVTPEYRTIDSETGENLYWQGNYVPYANEIKKMLEVDIQAETTAILTYQQHIKMIDDPYIKKLLERIIVDEKIHLTIFNTFLQKLENE